MNCGFEIFFATVCGDFQNKSDAIICRLHWIFLQNNYKLLNKNEKTTEILSKDYNFEKNMYNLIYIKNGEKYKLKISVENGKMDNKNKEAINEIPIDLYINGEYKNFDKVYNNLKNLDQALITIINSMGENLILLNINNVSQNPIQNIPDTKLDDSKSVHAGSLKLNTQTSSGKIHVASESGLGGSEEDYSSLRNPNRFDNSNDFPFNPTAPLPGKSQGQGPNSYKPPSIGRGDLDPFSGNPGMIFDPAHNMGPRGGGIGGFPDPNSGLPGSERLPPGAIPPGARFDPFGPANTFPEAKPDHMKPPDSDAYM